MDERQATRHMIEVGRRIEELEQWTNLQHHERIELDTLRRVLASTADRVAKADEMAKVREEQWRNG